MNRLDRKQVKTERIVRQHLRFDAALDADEDRFGVRPRFDQRLGEREGRHEVAAGAASGKENSHPTSPPHRVRSAECGVRNGRAGVESLFDLSLTLRIPHSTFRTIVAADLSLWRSGPPSPRAPRAGSSGRRK